MASSAKDEVTMNPNYVPKDKIGTLVEHHHFGHKMCFRSRSCPQQAESRTSDYGDHVITIEPLPLPPPFLAPPPAPLPSFLFPPIVPPASPSPPPPLPHFLEISELFITNILLNLVVPLGINILQVVFPSHRSKLVQIFLLISSFGTILIITLICVTYFLYAYFLTCNHNTDKIISSSTKNNNSSSNGAFNFVRQGISFILCSLTIVVLLGVMLALVSLCYSFQFH